MIRYFNKKNKKLINVDYLQEVAKCGKVSRDLSLKLPFEKGSLRFVLGIPTSFRCGASENLKFAQNQNFGNFGMFCPKYSSN